MAKRKIKKVSAPAKKVKKDDCGCKNGKCNCENRAIGLAMGLLLSGVHLFWLILVLLGVAKAVYDWILEMHMIKLSWSVMPFDWAKAIILLALTFIIGYILGWALAGLLKMARNQK